MNLDCIIGRRGLSSIVKVPRDVPSTTVYIFVLLAWPRVYLLATLVRARVCFLAIWSEKSQIFVIPVSKSLVILI